MVGIPFLRTLPVILTLLAVGCAGDHNESTGEQAGTTSNVAAWPDPEAGKSQMVFYRPFGYFTHQAYVFDITNNDLIMIGILPHKTKIAYSAAPGKRRYMVIAKNAHFLDADTASGKTYFARIDFVRQWGLFEGWGAPTFNLTPIVAGSSALQAELAESRWISKTASADKWAKENRPSVLKKKSQHFTEWQQKPDKPSLRPEDGR